MLGFTKRKLTNRLSAKKQISPLISDIEDILVITVVEVVLVFSSLCPRPPFLFYPPASQGNLIFCFSLTVQEDGGFVTKYGNSVIKTELIIVTAFIWQFGD